MSRSQWLLSGTFQDAFCQGTVFTDPNLPNLMPQERHDVFNSIARTSVLLKSES